MADTTSNSGEEYRMTVDLNVLEHLGINLYSNIAAVLTEAVANSWDADAENVEIRIDQDAKWIEIVDDGVGMSFSDLNDKYLRVGYRRRDQDAEHGKFTAKRRQVMGRKGLGKLSLFSIAESIDVLSAKDGEVHGLRMSIDGIKESVKNEEAFYKPDPLPSEEIQVTKGTKIVLNGIKRQRLGQGVAALHRRLARRFSVIGEQHKFKITINGKKITTADRGDLSIAQFLWTLGDFAPDAASIPKVLERKQLSNRPEGWPENWKVGGWIGTASLPKQLDDNEAGNLNSIVVLARGRLVHENILDKVNDGRLYTKYLTGQIEADFLDDDDRPDIATSDRQRIQEDDERYESLLSFLKTSLAQVKTQWTEWRRIHEVKKAKEDSPALNDWLDSLPDGFKQSAETLIAKLSALPVDDDEDRKTLYRHGIFAFERMRLRDSAEEFVRSVHDVNKLIETLADRDALEASLYLDIVRTRLEAIKEFQEIVDEDAKEKVLQRYLFDHLWLLDPAWERATDSEFMEKRLVAEGVITDSAAEKEKIFRVDIAYRTNAGKHIIVELKKASRKMELLELQGQGQKYVDKLRKILLAQGENNPNIEVVFVIGKPIDEEKDNPDRVKLSMQAVAPGSRIVHYDTLIKGAWEAYSEYISKSEKFNQLENIIKSI